MLGRAGLATRLREALVAFVLVFVAVSAHAAPAAQTFSLDYAVPEGCPARSTFVASIIARAPGSRETPEDAELSFDARIAAAGELTSGVLRVRFAHGERFEREVPAARCGDVATTMAIMAGLLLSGALLPELPPAATPDASAAAPRSEPTPAPAVPSVPPQSLEARVPVPPPARSSERLGRLRPGAFAHAALDLGALPFPAFGTNVGLDAALERASLFAPSVRAGFSYRAGRASEPGVGDGLFVVRALLLRGCPLRVPLGRRVFVHACALVDWGRLEVSGRDTTHPAERHMPWLALGGAGRLEARLGAVVSLEAEASIYGLSRHDQFVLEPGDVKLHEIPPVAGELALGVVVRVP